MKNLKKPTDSPKDEKSKQRAYEMGALWYTSEQLREAKEYMDKLERGQRSLIKQIDEEKRAVRGKKEILESAEKSLKLMKGSWQQAEERRQQAKERMDELEKEWQQYEVGTPEYEYALEQIWGWGSWRREAKEYMDKLERGQRSLIKQIDEEKRAVRGKKEILESAEKSLKLMKGSWQQAEERLNELEKRGGLGDSVCRVGT